MSGGGSLPGGSVDSFFHCPSWIRLVDRRERDHHAQREDGDARNVHKHEGQRSSTVSRELHRIHNSSPEGRTGVYGGVFCCRVILDLLLCTRICARKSPKHMIRGHYQRFLAMFVTPYLYKICIRHDCKRGGMGYSQKLKLCQYSTYVRHRAERAMSFVFDFRSADTAPPAGAARRL